MPKRAKELSAKAVQAKSRTAGMHTVGGVAGLILQVTETGASSWILRASVNGKRREIGLGSFADVPLATARDKARTMRATIADGIDPVEHRRAARAAVSAVLTFEEATKRLITAKQAEWKNAKHRAQWQATLDTYAKPTMGALPVASIELRHVVDVLTPIWNTKTETATRVRGRIESVLAWATVSGYRTGDNPARWKGNLDHVLPKPGKVRKVKHHAALPVDAMPDFMKALRKRSGYSARGLEFAILTAARSNEVRGATWSEIDLEGLTWTIPGERMKAGKEHRVPLPPQAVSVLKALPRIVGVDLVFPGWKGQPLSDASLAKPLKLMKTPATPHGFRSTFRDWASERSNYPRDVAEMALAHTIGDKVEAAYRRGDLFEKRTNMMADWAKFIETTPATGNVTSIRRAAG